MSAARGKPGRPSVGADETGMGERNDHVAEARSAHVTVHRLGPVSAVPVGEGRAYAVGEEQIAVFRPRGAQLRATHASCPHAGGPLADGTVDSGKVMCPLHNYLFSLTDGSCLNGGLAVKTFTVRDVDGQIMLETSCSPA